MLDRLRGYQPDAKTRLRPGTNDTSEAQRRADQRKVDARFAAHEAEAKAEQVQKNNADTFFQKINEDATYREPTLEHFIDSQKALDEKTRELKNPVALWLRELFDKTNGTQKKAELQARLDNAAKVFQQKFGDQADAVLAKYKLHIFDRAQAQQEAQREFAAQNAFFKKIIKEFDSGVVPKDRQYLLDYAKEATGNYSGAQDAREIVAQVVGQHNYEAFMTAYRQFSFRYPKQRAA